MLAIVSPKYKRIKIYDSYRLAASNIVVKKEAEKLSDLIPHYLMRTNFVEENGVGMSSSQEGKVMFEVIFIDNIPQQAPGNM